MHAAHFIETSLSMHQTTRHHVPEDINIPLYDPRRFMELAAGSLTLIFQLEFGSVDEFSLHVAIQCCILSTLSRSGIGISFCKRDVGYFRFQETEKAFGCLSNKISFLMIRSFNSRPV
jgi:hypothetical protein